AILAHMSAATRPHGVTLGTFDTHTAVAVLARGAGGGRVALRWGDDACAILADAARRAVGICCAARHVGLTAVVRVTHFTHGAVPVILALHRDARAGVGLRDALTPVGVEQVDADEGVGAITVHATIAPTDALVEPVGQGHTERAVFIALIVVLTGFAEPRVRRRRRVASELTVPAHTHLVG